VSPSSSGLTQGSVEIAYSETIRASGGVAPYDFELNNGTLPPGLILSSNGTLSGTPTLPGSYTFNIIVIDSDSCESYQSYTLSVGMFFLSFFFSFLPSFLSSFLQIVILIKILIY
jgi:large repetitive protein